MADSNLIKNTTSIIGTKYFSLDEAINSNVDSKNIFIIANERITKSGDVGRYYTVFPTFKDFLKNRDEYKHCHELLVDHKNKKPNIAGRLVFDFDIKHNDKIVIPNDFKSQIEDIVIDVVEKYFNNINPNLFEFIWSTSQNPHKFSKHLTVKNLYFDNWILMSKIFYKLFCKMWNEKYLWIKSNHLIDFQIVRKRASLRMVGSSKINGYILTFDNEKHLLTDSLIRIYLKNQKNNEQLVTITNINDDAFIDDIDNSFKSKNSEQITICMKDKNLRKKEKPFYEKVVYDKAYEIYEYIDQGVFKMGKINGNTLSLLRKKSNKCLLSGKIHDHENSFLEIVEEDGMYTVHFGCYRFCYKERTTIIGSITVKNLVVYVNPNFGPQRMHKH
ncbi:MAG: hypothetical protein Satyrvirus17_8 [Satyrvirus sp.]|uniref:Uncharacterized protein n=1 Tax=Satyrvirus sp. TaxID=2487771 RepID=A0A3G5AE95_9VIRU|nr:MAG: hypothetical protein Satyrvirus17_8 [Satyrvirus sp.]